MYSEQYGGLGKGREKKQNTGLRTWGAGLLRIRKNGAREGGLPGFAGRGRMGTGQRAYQSGQTKGGSIAVYCAGWPRSSLRPVARAAVAWAAGVAGVGAAAGSATGCCCTACCAC